MPGLYVFRALGGLVALPGRVSPDLLATIASDGATAALVVTGMALGLAIPIGVRDAVLTRWRVQSGQRDQSGPLRAEGQ